MIKYVEIVLSESNIDKMVNYQLSTIHYQLSTIVIFFYE